MTGVTAQTGGMAQAGAAAATVTRCVLWHAPATAPSKELLESLDARQVVVTACTDSYRAMALVCQLERANDRRIAKAAHEQHHPGVPVDAPGAGAALSGAAGVSGGTAQRDALVLLLVSPADLEDATPVVEAVKRYAPRTACWWYDQRANPRLRAVVEGDVASWQRMSAPRARPSPQPPDESPANPSIRSPFVGAPSGRPGPVASPRTPLRLTGHPDLPSEPAPPSQPGVRRPEAAGADAAARPADRPGLILTDEEMAMLLADDVNGPSAGASAAGNNPGAAPDPKGAGDQS